jgi:hypothetical protein
VLNSLQGAFAITAFRSFGGLVNPLLLQFATRGSNRSSLVLFSIVRMASYSGPTGIRHIDYKRWISRREKEKQTT